MASQLTDADAVGRTNGEGLSLALFSWESSLPLLCWDSRQNSFLRDKICIARKRVQLDRTVPFSAASEAGEDVAEAVSGSWVKRSRDDRSRTAITSRKEERNCLSS